MKLVAASTGAWRRMSAHPTSYSNTTPEAFTTTY